jgi:hypothetical protein
MPISRIEKSVAKLGNNAVYGDGSDGDVVITGNPITLTSDMYYNNLTINSGAFLLTNGFRVFVKNTLTINGAIGLGTFTGGVVGEPSSDIATGTISGVETASSSIVYSVGGTGGGGVGTPSATQLPTSYRNHINSLIASAVVTPSGVVAIKGGGKGTTGSQGITYPALTNSDTWTGKAGTAGSAGTGATNGTAGAAGSAGSGATAGGAGGSGSHIVTSVYTLGSGHYNHHDATLHASAGSAGTSGGNGAAGVAGSTGTNGTNGAAGTNGSPGTATGATPGVGGAGGTAGSGGGLVLIVAHTVKGSGRVISLGRSGSTGSVGTTGLGGTAGANGTGATAGANGVAGTGATAGGAGHAGSAGSAGHGGHHPALNSHHHQPHRHNTYRLHSHTAGAQNGPSTYHAGHPHPGHGHGHNAHHFHNGTYHHAAPHMSDAHHYNGVGSNVATNLDVTYDGNVHGHTGYRKYQPHVYEAVVTYPVHAHYPAQHRAGGAAGAAGGAGHPGTSGTNGARGLAGHPGTNGVGGLAAPSSGTGGTGKRGGSGGGGGIIIVTETTPTSLFYDTMSGLTADTDTYAATSGYSYVILNQ